MIITAIYNIAERYKNPSGYDVLAPLSSHNVVPCTFTETDSTITIVPLVPQEAWDIRNGIVVNIFGSTGSIPTLPTTISVYGSDFTISNNHATLLQRTVNRTGSALVNLVPGGYAFYCNTDSMTALKADEAAQVSVDGIVGVLPVTKGGTGVDNISDFRNNLGLGPTGAPIPITGGGTGATSAAGAKTTLGFATMTQYTGTLTTSWAGSNPYTQNVAISGITANDAPIIAPTLTSVLATDNPRIAGWGNIMRAYTYNGGITFVCYNIKTTVNIPFRCMVVR